MKKRTQRKGYSKLSTNSKINKFGQKYSVEKGKAKVVNSKDSKDGFSEMGNVSIYEKVTATNILTENKLVTTKPWFSKSGSEKSVSDNRNMNLEFASSMASDIRPCKNSSTYSSTNIYIYMILL